MRDKIPQLKIIVTGPRKSGKSSFIKNVCEKSVIDNEEENNKKLPMDLGSVNCKDYKVRVFGLPSQENLSFMFDILVKGASGAIILVDTSDEEKIQQIGEYVKRIKEKNIPFVVAGNIFDEENNKIDVLKQVVGEQSEIVEISTKKNHNTKEPLKTLINKILNSENPLIYKDNINIT